MTPCLKILFPCTGNSCRSQMTEGWVRHLKGEMLEWMRYVRGRHHAPPRLLGRISSLTSLSLTIPADFNRSVLGDSARCSSVCD